MRDVIRAEVAAITPFDELEDRTRQETLAWIDSGALLTRVSGAEPQQHLVSYFLVCSMDGLRCLLVDHRKAGLWLPSGGHVEADEHPRLTVRREAAEELGLDVTEVSAPRFLTSTETVGSGPRHVDVSLWYVLRTTRSTFDWDPGEFNGVGWFAWGEVPLDRADPQLGRFIGKLRGSPGSVPGSG